MNQSNLYATLSKAGYKILSFEDYPSERGSWRTSCMKDDCYCEISCNRFDGYMSLRAVSALGQARKSVINSMKFLTDEAELAAITAWLRSLRIYSNKNDSPLSNELVFVH